MRFSRLFLVLPVLLLTSLLVRSEPATVSDDDQDLVFFHDTQPVRIRFYIHFDGRPVAAKWHDALRHLFQYLDADGDGVLNRAEAGRAPNPQQLRQQLLGEPTVTPDPAPDFAALDRAPADAHVTLLELEAFYRRAGAGPLQMVMVRLNQDNGLRNIALFHYLDRNQDGKLSREELLAAPASLRALDQNDDEMITVQELLTGPAGARLTAPQLPDSAPSGARWLFPLLDPGESAAMLARQILAHYDLDGNKKLSRREITLEPALFDSLDVNRDGELDVAELEGWARQAPDLEVRFELGQGTNKLLGALSSPRQAFAVANKERDGSLHVTSAGVELAFDWGGSGRWPRSDVQRTLRKRFRELDTNGDGYLDSKEVFREPFDFVPLLRLADRDGDGRLSEKEIAAYGAYQEQALAGLSQLTITDHGRSLFDLLDTDHDGRLGPRELRSAWRRLAPWDRNGIGCVTAGELPRQFRLTVTPGRFQSSLFQGAEFTARQQVHPVGRRGPVWFRKMDRNGDGDLSLWEFLGSAEDFRRMDTDGDGLIDPEEAERADRWFRKRP